MAVFALADVVVRHRRADAQGTGTATARAGCQSDGKPTGISQNAGSIICRQRYTACCRLNLFAAAAGVLNVRGHIGVNRIGRTGAGTCQRAGQSSPHRT